jgi:hypothetical protein
MSETPKELSEFYESLESISSIDIWDIQTNLKPTEKLEGEWRDKLLTERKALFFNLNDGQLFQNAQILDVTGQATKLTLSEDEIEYLEERLTSASNPWIKSRYAHILWQEKKHTDYAETAIENYLITIEKVNPDSTHELHELPNLLTAAIFIATKSKKAKKKTSDVVIKLMNEKPLWIKSQFLRPILKYDILNKTQLTDIASLIPSWVDSDSSKSYHVTKSLLEQGITLYHRLGIREEILFEQLAKNEDIIIEHHTDETNFVRLTAIGYKAHYLKQAKMINESETLFAEYNKLKQKVKLHEISFDLDDEATAKFNEYLNRKSEFLLSLPTDAILSFFAMDDGILVDPEENEQISRKTIKDSVVHLFSTSVFDINTNFKDLSESEKFDAQKLQNYSISHAIRCHSFFLKVFIDGIITGKLNYYKVFKFFETQTWYGVPYNRPLTDKEIDRNATWLTMLAPSVQNLMAQFEMSVLMNTNRINNFILAIDSMTVKFEGALRAFIRFCGGNTTTTKSEEFSEQLLDELLENEITKTYFTEKDIELFKYTFTKSGRNLRNNVAHGFMHFSDYTWEAAILVFMCILRLGKYTLVEKQDQKN